MEAKQQCERKRSLKMGDLFLVKCFFIILQHAHDHLRVAFWATRPTTAALKFHSTQHADNVLKCTFSLHLSFNFQTFQLSFQSFNLFSRMKLYFKLNISNMERLIQQPWNPISPKLTHFSKWHPHLPRNSIQKSRINLNSSHLIHNSSIVQSYQPYFPNRSQVSSLSSLPALVPATIDPAWTPASALQQLSWFYISIPVSIHLKSSCKIKLNKN